MNYSGVVRSFASPLRPAAITFRLCLHAVRCLPPLLRHHNSTPRVLASPSASAGRGYADHPLLLLHHAPPRVDPVWLSLSASPQPFARLTPAPRLPPLSTTPFAVYHPLQTCAARSYFNVYFGRRRRWKAP